MNLEYWKPRHEDAEDASLVNNCEVHDEPGECTMECYYLLQNMMGGSYSDLPYDPTGCSNPKPMPYDDVEFDEKNKRILLLKVHPEDCQCGDPRHEEDEGMERVDTYLTMLNDPDQQEE